MINLWVIVGFGLYYLIKGVVWVIVDVSYFKTKYDNPLQPVFNIIFWPIFSTRRTIIQITSWFKSRKYAKSKSEIKGRS